MISLRGPVPGSATVRLRCTIMSRYRMKPTLAVCIVSYAGKALGFVAGGGGARGSAHLGVYKAFREVGAEFDIFGGTSSGAAMTAALAYGVAPERVDGGTDNIFVKRRAFRRPTWPRYGLIDHKVFDAALKAEYADVLIEDLWLPYFAVSCNLSDHKPRIHRSGPVWQAVRASSSIPAMLPPFITTEGEMLVDGALVDNIPLVQMQKIKSWTQCSRRAGR